MKVLPKAMRSVFAEADGGGARFSIDAPIARQRVESMCGRFALHDRTWAEIAEIFDTLPFGGLLDVPNYNICPTNAVASVVGDGNERKIVPMRWGFIPKWYKSPNGGPLLINARAESIADKPAFRDACRQRRCLIPASGFFEWTKSESGRRIPWYIFPSDRKLFAFAGIWQEWNSGAERHVSCAIVTTSANRTLSNLHHRMPVTVRPENYALWLGEEGKGAARLMRPADDEFFEFHEVGREVNSNRSQGPELIEPLDGGMAA